MARRCVVPEALKYAPFTLEDARAAGLTRDHLRGSEWKRLHYGWYRWRGRAETEKDHLDPVFRALPRGAAFAGVTAARLHGLDLPRESKPEVLVPRAAGIAERVHAVVSRTHLDPEEITWRDGYPVTTALRTCFDLAGRFPVVEAVVVLDAATHAGLFDAETFETYVLARPNVSGVAAARRILPFIEPLTESPMETRLRMVLLLRGLPRPLAQVPLYDAQARFVGRPDLYYPAARLGIEYDGDNHRDRLTSDARRENRLQEIGVRLLRYTGPDVFQRPDAIAGEVRGALALR